MSRDLKRVSISDTETLEAFLQIKDLLGENTDSGVLRVIVSEYRGLKAVSKRYEALEAIHKTAFRTESRNA
ncbi:hypothetical protein [Flagellimonas algicola]|uniref:Uncharacterized protein n=1 Tax=Flagellimonas algicola TaxID=2583815 RepID=A0ABY2WP97_9FLAO|nr:hypothetical protein [Allomuricauda algicola]TMU56481.1 hypothetical protein FGG15_02780 [Allomuricauda algicola]